MFLEDDFAKDKELSSPDGRENPTIVAFENLRQQ
jgi:hypothetical protein